MSEQKEDTKELLTQAFTASLIRFAVISYLVLMCFWAFAPFLPILMWAMVLAIALYPARRWLESKLKWSASKVSTLIVLVGVLLIGVPTTMVANSFATKTLDAYEDYQQGALVIPAPKASVEDWPLVGEDVYDAWSEASTDMSSFIDKRQPQLKAASSWLVSAAGGAASNVFFMIGAIIVAGIMLAWAEPATKSMRKIFTSFSDEVKGPELHNLTTATIRQVAIGVIGIAFLTAMTFGATVALAGVPAAALFTVIALLFAIMQLPVTLIAIVTTAILWSIEGNSTLHNGIFTVLMIAASLVDNVLKPMILGRGLEVPMPVVLIGAIGGMMSGGILGMFVGAAFLTAGYQVFMKWVDSESDKKLLQDSKESKDNELAHSKAQPTE